MTASTGLLTYLPRRRRTHVCPHLRVEGAAVTLERVRDWTIQRGGPTIAPALQRLAIWCGQRRERVSPKYADDVCTSSWGRGCPFLPEGTTP